MSLAPIYELLDRNAQERPEGVFFIYRDTRVRYREAAETVKRTASYLRGGGIIPGDRILLQLGNCPEFIYLYLAALQLGALPLLVNPAARRYELRYYCEKARPRLAFTTASLREQYRVDGTDFMGPGTVIAADDHSSGGHRSRAAAMPPLETFEPSSPETPAALIFTSATGGYARGALLTHGGIFTAVEAAHRMIVDRDDIFLSMLPFFHSFGLTTSLVLPLYSGTPFICLDRFSPRAVPDLIPRERVSITCAVPAIYEILARTLPPHTRFPGMKAWICGGEALSSVLQASLMEKHGMDVRQGYGLTEASPIVTWNDMDHQNRPGSAGLPMPYNEIRISGNGPDAAPGAEGEVLVRGANVIPGYFEDEQSTREAITDGWLRTGDLGHLDADNYLYITGRMKDMVIRRGLNVYPREVEKILSFHPEVQNVHISGHIHALPDHSFKESLRAEITVKKSSAISVETMLEWCRENISAYKIPEGILIRHSQGESPFSTYK